MLKRWLTRLAWIVPIFSTVTGSVAQSQVETSRATLMAVLREAIGQNKESETLEPVGKFKFALPDGKEVEGELAAYAFIGDLHIRFVFDGPSMLMGAVPGDLANLGLSAEQALTLSVDNLRRTYGEPKLVPFGKGITSLEGRSPDLNSSYMLDREFWRRQLKSNPAGLVVTVGKRGGLLFAPASNVSAVETLRRSIKDLHASSERLRVSSAVYLFKDDSWTILQAPANP